jgi:cob(I)alamin adenosyltransferase
MAKHTRIYTRAGDDGTTGLVGGARVKKNDLRIEAYGTIDELSSFIGVARSHLAMQDHDAGAARLDAWLAWTQDMLFNAGAQLATPISKRWADMPLVSQDDVNALERAIDETEEQLPVLANFIHPGGGLSGAFLHVSRTVCRRAERQLITLRDADQQVPAECVRFLNRLSDALFVWARWSNARAGANEHLWNAKAIAPAGSALP